MPSELSDLTYESQLAFEVYRYLPGRWEGMSGTYMGKDLTILPFLFKQYKIDEEDASHVLYLIQYIDDRVSERMVEKKNQNQQMQEAKAKWQKK